MASSKQRRDQIRSRRAAKVIREKRPHERTPPPAGSAPVNRELLAPSNSYGTPDFVRRGYYVDTPFRCVDCQKEEVWTATQQKWWYEVAKGYAYSIAKRCRPCRKVRKRGGPS